MTLDDLTETEIGDWKMPDFKTACAYAASQGWLIVEDDVLTLTKAGVERSRSADRRRLAEVFLKIRPPF